MAANGCYVHYATAANVIALVSSFSGDGVGNTFEEKSSILSGILCTCCHQQGQLGRKTLLE